MEVHRAGLLGGCAAPAAESLGHRSGEAGVIDSPYPRQPPMRYGIRVNCVVPGLGEDALTQRITGNETSLRASIARHPLRRIGESADVASQSLVGGSPELLVTARFWGGRGLEACGPSIEILVQKAAPAKG